MGRLPKIILTIATMTAIFLWVSLAFNSCGDKADGLIDDSATSSEVTNDDSRIFDADNDNDIFGSDSAEDPDFEIEEDDEEVEYVDDPAEIDFTEPEPERTRVVEREKTPAPVATNNNSGNSYGEYMVIAGNYLVESNAKAMMKKLSNLGYNNSDVSVFDNSQYHTVIASRHDSYGSALEIASAIRRQGVDCYVKKKQY